MKDVRLEIVISSGHKTLVKEIIEGHHSYVASAVSVGRRIDWLIYHDNKCVGMIGVGSSVYPPPKDILHHLGISKAQYREVFNSFANNWRFCLTKSIKNLGTRVLRELRNEAPVEWKRKYGNRLDYLITFVGGGNTGAVYKADNWECIGETAGLPAHKSLSMKWDTLKELKNKFVKPTGENKKLIFFKRIDHCKVKERFGHLERFI